MEAVPSAELVYQQFPELNSGQRQQYEQLATLYGFWNQRINVISRKDIHNIYRNHVLHSLGAAKIMQFTPKTEVLDVGTGGGFPGIPLAIMYPQTQFHLIDSIGKKIKVVQAVTKELQLENVSCQHIRAEQIKRKFDLIMGRAVSGIPTFISWIKDNIRTEGKVALLKGGDLGEEIRSSGLKPDQYDLEAIFAHNYFRQKKILVFKAGDIAQNFRQPTGSGR